MRYFKDWINTVTEATSTTRIPAIYQRWAAISAVAGALGRKCWFDRGKRWHLRPNQYIILVGSPSTGKGGSLQLPYKQVAKYCAVNGPVDRAGEGTWKQYTERPLRYMEGSNTIEKLIEEMEKFGKSPDPILSSMHEPFFDSSCTVMTPELGIFIRPEYLYLQNCITDFWDCPDEFIYRTKNKGENFVRGVCLNWVCATTIESFNENLPASSKEQGLLSRMLMVYHDAPAAPPTLLSEEYPADLIEKLRKDYGEMLKLNGCFKATTEALGFMQDFLKTCHREYCISPTLEHYWSRRDSHFLKLCMALSAARSNSMIIEFPDVSRAEEYLLEVEKGMPNVLATFGETPSQKLYRQIREVVKSARSGTKITPQWVMAQTMGLVLHFQAAEILPGLVQEGLLLTSDGYFLRV
ncbi:MAG: hypothetical protein EBR82_51380 [Caulobacteraceae bacterium]|nr:hypothetical protein [Caulobacteraceae bacterium]